MIRAFFIVILLSVLGLMQSCFYSDVSFDNKKAGEIVKLNNNDLNNFSKLKYLLLRDYKKLRIQDSLTNAASYNSSKRWFSTNTYYLNKIDSADYTNLLSKLRERYYDNFFISDSGKVIFILKRNVWMKSGDYNDSHDHLLISSNCNYRFVLGRPDSLYRDSTINKDWKYVYAMYHTGW